MKRELIEKSEEQKEREKGTPLKIYDNYKVTNENGKVCFEKVAVK